jgi:hypothetical protein
MAHPATPSPALPTLRPQEIAFENPHSRFFFQPKADLPFVATRAAFELFGVETIHRCLSQLQDLAKEHGGIDYLQVFLDPTKPENLWFIEDGPGGAITALLPSDY